MIILKRIFILIYIPIIFFSFLILFSDLYGSPFYLILTEKKITNYINKYYTTLRLDEVFFDGEYKAIIHDRLGDSYIMSYDPRNDKINDTYYEETVVVMRSLYRNNIRQLLNYEGIEINSDDIILELSIPMYVFETGQIGSGDECDSKVTIYLNKRYQDSSSFAKDAFTVLKSLRHYLIKISNLTILGYSDKGVYSVSGNDKIYPANEETTKILTQFDLY